MYIEKRKHFLPHLDMALTRTQKEEQLNELKEKISHAKSIIFTHYIGLKVSDISTLRAQLKEKNAEMKVSKKTLLQIATKDLKMPEITENAIPGAIACIFSNEDPVAGASVALQFSKTHTQVKLIGGIFEGKVLTTAETVNFAALPSRQTLLGTFVTMINMPLTNFATVTNTPLINFARAIAEIAKKKNA